MTPTSALTIIYNPRTEFLYKISKVETNLDVKESQYATEVATITRLGDEKSVKIPTTTLKQRYEFWSEEQVQSLYDFLKQYPNRDNLPIKFKKIFYFGHTTEAYRKSEEKESVGPTKKETNIKFGQIVDTKSVNFNKLVVNPDILKSLQIGLAKIKHQDFLTTQWDLKSLGENLSRNILNFYGPPGTGKTLSATAVAQQLQKPLLQVDYSQVESKWVGETEKNIQSVFQSATDLGCVLLLDEADSLVSKRAEGGSHQANFMNLARNVFMQELDKFQGVVILTTNLFANYDEALLRRVSQHIEFTLPDTSQRAVLFRNHIPSAVPLKDVDLFELARLSNSLSGGDIKVVCVEAMTMAVMNSDIPTEAQLSMQDLLTEVKKVKAAKQVHSGSKSPIGIM